MTTSRCKTAQPTAESIYCQQHALIATAIGQLQATLDQMNAPTREITWRDTTEFAHVAAAASVLIESIQP